MISAWPLCITEAKDRISHPQPKLEYLAWLEPRLMIVAQMISEPEADGFIFRVFLGGREWYLQPPCLVLMGVLSLTSMSRSMNWEMLVLPSTLLPPRKTGVLIQQAPQGCRTARRGCPANPAGLSHCCAPWLFFAGRIYIFRADSGLSVSQLPEWLRAPGWELTRVEEAERTLAWLLPSPTPQHWSPWGQR